MPLDLEHLNRRPEGEAKPVAILCIHGANGGAWTWDVNFLPYFASRGYAAHAISLRGHGAGSHWYRLVGSRIADYADDVAGILDAIDMPAVLVGHSMGVLVIQRALARREAAGFAMLAPVPPSGLLHASAGLFHRDPLLFWQMAMVQSLGPWTASPKLIRRALFSDSLSDPDVAAFFAHSQAESPLAVLDMMGPGLPSQREIDRVRARTPILVVGAGNDAFFPPPLVTETARAYGVEPVILDGMAHAIMLEPDWARAADAILDWIETTVLAEIPGR